MKRAHSRFRGSISVSESLLALPPGLPLEFLQLEKLLMSYRSVHVVIDERARTDMLEGRFFQHLIGTWISLNIFGGLRLKKIDSSIPLPATGLCT